MSTFSRKTSSNGISTDDDHFWRSNPPKPSDYAEIFGGVASSCSIPVLDLPPAGGFDGRDVFRSSAVDYLDIFGGLEDGAFGVEYEELFGGFEEERIQKETKSFQESSDVSRYFLKDPRWDNSPVSSKEATKKLSGSTEQTNLSYQKQTSESKDSKANGRTYVEAIPRATSEDDEYLSPPPKFDASPVPTSKSSRHSLVSNRDLGIDFTKTVQPAASFGSSMRHVDDLYSDQKPSDLRSTPSEDTSANEQYHSCSSTDQSEFDVNESLVDLSASHQCSDDSGSGWVAEVDQLKKPASPTPLVASKNYTQEMTRPIMEQQPVLDPIYSGDVPSQPHIDPYSNAPGIGYVGSAFTGDSTVEGQSANGSKSERALQNQSINSYNQYMDPNNGKLQGKTLLKASSLDSLTKNGGHVSENLPTRGLHHAHSFDSSSATPSDKSCHDARFLTISNVNLRTQPSKVPPPARPPPKICIGQAPPKIVKSADLKACTGDSSHFFDVEVDASSAAAASAAAMKEAMEHAQARLKSAKESMERKKENLQSRKRFAKAEILTGKEEKVGVVAQVAHSSGEVVIPNDDRINNTGGHRPKSRRLGEAVPSHQADERYFDLAKDSLKKSQDSSSRSSQVPYVQGDRAAEWKVEEQFFELVNNEKKPEKVQEYFVFEVDKNKQKKSIQTDEDKTNKKADKLVHDGKWVDKLAVHKGGSLGDKEDGFKERREVREADKIKEVQEPLVETPLQANRDELTVNLVSDQEKEIEKQAERCTSCEHDLKISEETTTSIDYGTKLNGLSESSEEKETSVKDDHAFESNEKLVNSTEDGCLHEHDKNIDSRSHTLEEEKETQECRNSIEALPVSHALETPNDDDRLVEVVAVPSEDPCDHLEKKPIPKEHVVPTQEGETNLNGAKESCDEMEPDRTKVSGRKTNESEDHADNESSPFSGTRVENATKVESSWQYICEKIIIETQERSEPDVENKEAAKSDSELKHFQDQQVNIHGDNKPGKVEAFVPTVASCNAQTEGRISESAQKACQTVGNEMEVLDSQPATASSVDHTDIVQTPEKFTEREDPEISDNNIARNLEIEERMREERAKKEIEEELERARRLEEEKEREREREKDRLAFERASREARDRAIMEARERAERAAMERVTAEARQRALAEAREKAERASAEAAFAEKASKDSRLRAERAAVERATAEARERAAERALAEKAAQEAKQRAEKSTTIHRDQQKKASEYDMHDKKFTGMKHSASFPDFPREHQKRSDSSDNVGRFEGESAVRCKARLERHQRTVERAAKALAEKNMRDILAQREQAERNRFAETLDADVRRWSAGKEGNLRALLSTLQYILGPDSGWQPVSLTEVITAAAVKKVYRKATLCVHPDKLQQRGASIQQKYICEKVFDLLKEAWNRFNSEER